MKKKIIIIATAVLILLGIIALIFNWNKKVIIYTDIHSSYNAGLEKKIVLKDYEECQAYVTPLLECSTLKQSFLDKIADYDEAFFEEKMLVIICYSDPSSSSKISVPWVNVEDDTVHIMIKRWTARPSTEMSMDFGILVELPKDENVSQVTYEVLK